MSLKHNAHSQKGNSLGPLEEVYIDWKGLAQWEHRSRMIRRGNAFCKAMHQLPTIPRHYSVQLIKVWIGKCAIVMHCNANESFASKKQGQSAYLRL